MERNITLDYFKVLLSIFVITVHIGPLTASYPHLNWLISQGLGRITVPCFFIINGYYLVKKIDDNKAMKKYILHLLLIYAVWSTIYISLYIKEINLITLLEYCAFGILHLWYVAALISGSILFFLVKKIVKKDNVLLILSIVILLVGIFLEPFRGEYLFVVRNGFFIGFPFVFLGYYIHAKNLVNKVKNIYLTPLVVLSFIALCVESSFARLTGFYHDLYFSQIIFCPAVLLFVFKHSHYKKNNTYLTYLGSLASAIYFIHYFVIIMLADIEMPYMIIRFAIVLLLSIFLSVLIIYINKRIKIFL
ncbi:MAG: acyltransferase [Prevotella sp.]|jgi:surface polysaccharide O-acyltransferase-like enzyme|nr:acyltransferase [Prevotella sp.]